MRRTFVLLPFLLFSFLAASSAEAVSFPLDVEFDDGSIGTFANVEVTESGGDLDFVIEVPAGSDLGANADLQEIYFNLDGVFNGLGLSSSDTQHPNGQYTLLTDPRIKGGAGSSFDFGVNFGDGAGPPGNGILQLATFTLSADELLTVDDLLVTSMTAQGIEVQIAGHFQGTDFAPPVTSETVGGNVPEPGTGLLMLCGLVAVTARRSRQR